MPNTTQHDCADHLRHREALSVEYHGVENDLGEMFHDVWEECMICGERYDGAELDRLLEASAVAAGDREVK